MIKKVHLGPQDTNVFGNPAPLGLLGQAITTIAILPVVLRIETTKEALITAAIFSIFFGAGCQLITGILNFANKNTFGGAILTAFAFMGMKNAVEFYLAAHGTLLSPTINFVVDALLVFVFIVLAYGFGFFNRALFVYLVVICMIFFCKVVNFITQSDILLIPMGVFLFLMAATALWIAFSALINPVAGIQIFRNGPPVFRPSPKGQLFDFSIRNAVFTILYDHWKDNAFRTMPFSDLESRVKSRVGERNIVPDLFYLQEYGSLVMTFSGADQSSIEGLRLTSSGIDLYEQLILKKYDF